MAEKVLSKDQQQDGANNRSDNYRLAGLNLDVRKWQGNRLASLDALAEFDVRLWRGAATKLFVQSLIDGIKTDSFEETDKHIDTAAGVLDRLLVNFAEITAGAVIEATSGESREAQLFKVEYSVEIAERGGWITEEAFDYVTGHSKEDVWQIAQMEADKTKTMTRRKVVVSVEPAETVEENGR